MSPTHPPIYTTKPFKNLPANNSFSNLRHSEIYRSWLHSLSCCMLKRFPALFSPSPGCLEPHWANWRWPCHSTFLSLQSSRLRLRLFGDACWIDFLLHLKPLRRFAVDPEESQHKTQYDKSQQREYQKDKLLLIGLKKYPVKITHKNPLTNSKVRGLDPVCFSGECFCTRF